MLLQPHLEEVLTVIEIVSRSAFNFIFQSELLLIGTQPLFPFLIKSGVMLRDDNVEGSRKRMRDFELPCPDGRAQRLCAADVASRFKYRQLPRLLALEQSDVSNDDMTTIILCAIETLHSPSYDPKLRGLGGLVPCEGYFVVINVENPRQPILEKGFIFFPPSDTFSHKKEAEQNLATRIKTYHGIDATRPGASIGLLRKQLYDSNDLSMSIMTKVDELSGLMQVVTSAAKSTGVVKTCVFVCDADQFNATRMALHWLQARSDVKMPPLCVKKTSEVFPDMSEIFETLIGADQFSQVLPANRCVAHPIEKVGSYGNLLHCSKDYCRRLHHQLCKYAEVVHMLAELAEGVKDVVADDGARGDISSDDDDDIPSFLKGKLHSSGSSVNDEPAEAVLPAIRCEDDSGEVDDADDDYCDDDNLVLE